MRTPEHKAHARAGKKFEEELDMHYLSPGAFTVLPLDPDRLPDPPPAPLPYRLPVANRRHRHQSFAIIGEISSSNPNSRSTSPTGRVSPFRGHGFNPTGSRHVSPSVSPIPPEDPRAFSPNPLRSKIPKPAANKTPRKSSTGAVFGEKITHVGFQELSRKASQSLPSLDDVKIPKRPPPNPRKKLKNAAAFKQLSPIQGSSPEPSQSLSSPSRIPTKSRSTPVSRLTSPTRESSRVPNRSQSRPNLAKSRNPSPLTSPTKIPVNNTKYHHVKSRINSFNKASAKVPLSSDLSEDSESPRKKVLSRKNSFKRTASRPNLLPKTFMGSKAQLNTSDSSASPDPVESSRPKPKVPPKPAGAKLSVASSSGTATSVANSSSTTGKAPNSVPAKTKPAKGTNSSQPSKLNSSTVSAKKPLASEPQTPKPASNKEKTSSSDSSNAEDTGKKSSVRGSKVDLTKMDSDDALPSAIDVVSSTTNTVTKPLKIETPLLSRAKPVSPMIDGRVLSATSVSQAINKMNDTVLNTQTLIKDSGLPQRPVSTAIPTTKADASGKTDDKEGPKPDARQEPLKKPDDKPIVKQAEAIGKPQDDKTAKVAPNIVNTHTFSTRPTFKNTDSQNSLKIPETINNHHSNNHTTNVGLGHAKAIEREVQNNMNKLLGSMDSNLGGSDLNKKSANERIREARTVIAADVKPIKITVREKPSELDVQSGNVRPHFANGVNERPSLPPSQQQPSREEPAKDETPPNRCKRFLNSCTRTLTCNSCQRCKRAPKAQNPQHQKEQEEEEEEKSGCFKCLCKKTKKADNKRERVRINIEDETDKKTVWQKLNCCKTNKIGDTQSCFPLGKRKQSWMQQRAGTFLESEEQQKTKCCSKDGFKSFFRKIFCCCCKKKEELPPPTTARKESMVSSKKKSLTPTSVPPPEDTTPKIDSSLVEHTSHMKGAIPVLPVCLAWFCCVMNCIGPGTGTILSGLFCLCIGKPRFSQKDGPKPRVGAFIIDLIIGFSQFFTVLFCLVGWGWSIWWGVIMVKVAKKHRKIKHLEKLEERAAKPQPLAGRYKRDVERGRK